MPTSEAQSAPDSIYTDVSLTSVSSESSGASGNSATSASSGTSTSSETSASSGNSESSGESIDSSNALAITELKNQIEALKIAIQQGTLVMPTPRVRTQLNRRPLTESSGDEYEKPMRELCLADTRLRRVYSRKDGSTSNTRVDDFYSAVVKWEEYDNASDEGEWSERLATTNTTMNRHIHSLSRSAMARRMVAASSTDNSSVSNSSTLPRWKNTQSKGFGRHPRNDNQQAVDSAMLPEVIMANMASLHTKLEFITKTVMAQSKHITRPRWRRPHLKGFGRKPLNNRGVTVLPSRL